MKSSCTIRNRGLLRTLFCRNDGVFARGLTYATTCVGLHLVSQLDHCGDFSAGCHPLSKICLQNQIQKQMGLRLRAYNAESHYSLYNNKVPSQISFHLLNAEKRTCELRVAPFFEIVLFRKIQIRQQLFKMNKKMLIRQFRSARRKEDQLSQIRFKKASINELDATQFISMQFLKCKGVLNN